MDDIKRRRYLVRIVYEGEILNEMTSDDRSVAYGSAYSTLITGNTEAKLYDGDELIPMEEVETYMAELSGNPNPASDMMEDLRGACIKTDHEALLITADYLRDLAHRIECTPVTVYEVLVFEHTHEGKCLGVRATGWYTEPDMLEGIKGIVQRQLDDNIDAKIEERQGMVVMGDEKWDKAVDRCVEQGIIPPLNEE